MDIKKSLDYKIKTLENAKRKRERDLNFVLRELPRKRILQAFTDLVGIIMHDKESRYVSHDREPDEKLESAAIRLFNDCLHMKGMNEEQLLLAFWLITRSYLVKFLDNDNPYAYLSTSLQHKYEELRLEDLPNANLIATSKKVRYVEMDDKDKYRHPERLSDKFMVEQDRENRLIEQLYDLDAFDKIYHNARPLQKKILDLKLDHPELDRTQMAEILDSTPESISVNMSAIMSAIRKLLRKNK